MSKYKKPIELSIPDSYELGFCPVARRSEHPFTIFNPNAKPLTYLFKFTEFGVSPSKGVLLPNSYKDAAPFFISRGYQQIETSDFINGDIVIMQAWKTQRHGHIMAFYNGGWYSDFIQNGFFPESENPKHKVFRYMK